MTLIYIYKLVASRWWFTTIQNQKLRSQHFMPRHINWQMSKILVILNYAKKFTSRDRFNNRVKLFDLLDIVLKNLLIFLLISALALSVNSWPWLQTVDIPTVQQTLYSLYSLLSIFQQDDLHSWNFLYFYFGKEAR